MPSWFSSLHAVVDPFIQICLLRRGPQDLPTSGILLAIALTAHTVVVMLFFTLYGNVVRALLSGLLDTVLLTALTALVLYTQNKGARFVQTLTALAGTAAIITLISVPLTGWYLAAEAQGSGAVMLLLVLMVWSLAIAGHILRHALSAPYFVGLLVAIGFAVVSIMVSKTLFSPVG